LRASVERGDAICAAGTLDERSVRDWTEVNSGFHRVIVEATENHPLSAAHELVCRHPLVGPASLAFSKFRLAADSARIAVSQAQHRVIFEAIRQGEGTRAEHLAREHIHQARDNNAQHFNPTTGVLDETGYVETG
jgi:GntR family transcriptional regulator of vanillate catabolism